MKYKDCSLEKTDKLKQYRRLYYLKNKDKMKEINKRSINKRKEQDLATYIQRNKKRCFKHSQTPKGIFGVIKERCKSGRYVLNITGKEFEEWYLSKDKKCVFCDIPHEELHKINQKRLSIDRINNSRGYEIDNIQLACLLCNRVKNDIFSNEEIREIAQKYIKPKWTNQ